MRVVIAVPGPAGDRLAGDAERWGHAVVARPHEPRAVESALAATAPATLVAAAAQLTPGIVAAADARGVRTIALVGSDEERRHVAELGILETADAASGWSELEAIAGGVAPREPVAPSGRGTVIAVWGPTGAPGRTSIAIALAAELALAGHRVALADVDTHGASVAPALGLLDEAPGFAAACRLASTDALDRRELERIAQWYSLGGTGFWALTGLGRPSRWPELSADRVRGVLEACRDWVDVTVLDTAASLESDEEIASDLFAPRRNAATLTAVAEADRLVAVGSADPVGIARLIRTHADLLEVATDARVSVVMNRLRASVIGAAPGAQVTQTLGRFGGIEPAALVPYDRAAFDAALLAARTVAEVAPRSPARAELQRLARGLALVPVPAGAA
ncbi:regulator [Galbitalea sp. SE-J8]|uniref:AAA family ATPase n=1 Tax=Galbitalea sp. SE-J8 TaxID=3054952 RepID=UPI00259D0910|nr:regulator [Galbitalea sp. SE-J8]MDM4762695.1 regulator [Galbitalea sp. SE-J8]